MARRSPRHSKLDYSRPVTTSRSPRPIGRRRQTPRCEPTANKHLMGPRRGYHSTLMGDPAPQHWQWSRWTINEITKPSRLRRLSQLRCPCQMCRSSRFRRPPSCFDAGCCSCTGGTTMADSASQVTSLVSTTLLARVSIRNESWG